MARAAAVSPALGVSEAVSPRGPGGLSLGGSRGGRLGEGSQGEGGLQGPLAASVHGLSVFRGPRGGEVPGEGRTQASRAVGCCGGRSPASGGAGLAGLRRRSPTVPGGLGVQRAGTDAPLPTRKALRGPAVSPVPSSTVPASRRLPTPVSLFSASRLCAVGTLPHRHIEVPAAFPPGLRPSRGPLPAQGSGLRAARLLVSWPRPHQQQTPHL